MKLKYFLAALLCSTTTISGSVAFAQHKKDTPINYRTVPVVDSAVGVASYYADKFNGRKTASGELFSQQQLTCAHNTLPFGTNIKVTNLLNQKTVVVRVNDRLHRNNPRLVDLSKAAATQLGLKSAGIVRVKVEVIRADSLKFTTRHK